MERNQAEVLRAVFGAPLLEELARRSDDTTLCYPRWTVEPGSWELPAND